MQQKVHVLHVKHYFWPLNWPVGRVGACYGHLVIVFGWSGDRENVLFNITNYKCVKWIEINFRF